MWMKVEEVRERKGVISDCVESLQDYIHIIIFDAIAIPVAETPGRQRFDTSTLQHFNKLSVRKLSDRVSTSSASGRERGEKKNPTRAPKSTHLLPPIVVNIKGI